MIRFTERLVLALAIAAVVSICGCEQEKTPPETTTQPNTDAAQIIREPARAGPQGFYASDPAQLRSYVEEQLAAAGEVELPGRLIALMAPHAGYAFSGSIAAASYAAVGDQQFDTVIVVGPSHGVDVDGAALSDATIWRMPMGDVRIDTEMCAALREASERIKVFAVAHQYEHCLETQLPFLQAALGEFSFVPLVMTDFSKENCSAIAQAIVQVAKDRLAARSAAVGREGGSVLLVASSDMSHYPAYEQANRADKAMLEALETLDLAKVRDKDRELLAEGVANLGCTLCGLGPVLTVMEAAKGLGADQVKVIKYANSGDVPIGDRRQCVGYGAVAFCGSGGAPALEKEGANVNDATAQSTEGELNEQQQQVLLELARKTVAQYVKNRTLPDLPTGDPAFEPERAVFVTLHEHGQLRGCIGTLEAREPLAQAVRSSAKSAATEDFRFSPVTADEVADLHIEVSVLSPLRKVASADEIVVGKHGVVVKQGMRQGVFLPQVAPEQGWDRDTMLNNLCAHKAGLPADAWKQGAELYVFTSQVFAEAED